MSALLVLGSVWILAATGVALLPMRLQFIPGVFLLAVSPLLLGLIAWFEGVWFFLIAVFVVGSMFRRPLAFFGKKGITLIHQRLS